MSTRISTLPSRYPEIGRVRLGSKGPKGEPRKGKTLRFSSDDHVVLSALAEQLGGEVKTWPDGEQAWHLTSESASVPILLPPDPIDTTYERWGSGGIAKRCDGERCIMPVQSPDGGHMVESDCACLAEGLIPGDRDDQKKGACQVTVRLRLIIPSVPGLGAWLCTSHSIYAAMELPGQVELLQAMSGRGRLVPADFAIEPRTEKKPWEKYKRDYIVPVLRVRASLAQLASGESVAGELTPGEAEPLIDCPVGCGERAVRERLRAHLVDQHGWSQTERGVLPPTPANPPTPAPPHPPAENGAHDAPAGVGSGTEGGEAAGAPGAPPSCPTTGVSGPQLGKIAVLLANLGVPDTDRHRYVSSLIGLAEPVTSMKALTKRQASAAIEALSAEEAGVAR